MAGETFTITLDGASVTAVRTRPEGKGRLLFGYTPGAGSNVHDPFGRYIARRVATCGVSTVLAQFPYMEARKRRPDPPPVLEATWRAVIEMMRQEGLPLIVGGRSMGGRIASQVIAAGERVDGLALFAYPLHPPGKPEQRRDAHLSRVGVPVFFCSGTRDAFASADELSAAAALVPRATVHLLDGADHGFAVPKSSGRTREDVWSEASDAFLGWLSDLV